MQYLDMKPTEDATESAATTGIPLLPSDLITASAVVELALVTKALFM